jgi:HEAT repeat protein
MRSRRASLFPLHAILVAFLLLPLPAASGHGGAFRGPNGGVPPGLRPPGDPEPPPPPPSEGGDPGGPTTGDEGSPPVTPPDSGHGTAPEGGPPAPPGPTPGGGGRGRTKTSLTYESWRFWWAYNNDDILNLRREDPGVVTDSGVFGVGRPDRENRRSARRPTQWEVTNAVLPALLRCIDARDHEDVHGGAIIAAAKLGTGKLIPLFEEVIWNRRTNERGERMDYGPQARESAALALGLLPRLDDASRAVARRILLEAVADDALRTRERTWAAVSLGLRRDREAVAPLLELLARRYPDDNVPAGIVAGLGLIGDGSARADLEEIFVHARFRGRDVPPRVRPFAGYALGKLGDPAALPAVLKVLGSRRSSALVTRSAAVAAGALGEHAGATEKADAAAAILRALRSIDDATTRDFSLIALGRIGTTPALLALLEEAENGRPGSRAFAALGLSTHVFYADRAAADGSGAPVDAALRRRIAEKLAQVSGRLRDAETRGAFLLARGLVKDSSALDELVETVRRPGDTTLRGFACVALGLLGRPTDEVKDALRTALAERTHVDLRRDAATGLGLLRDAGTVPHLLDQLSAASSFAVQGQVVAAIGAIGDQRALAPLVTLLEDRRQAAQVRALAAVGLGLIGDERPLPPLARVSRDYNYRASLPDLDELLLIF